MTPDKYQQADYNSQDGRKFALKSKQMDLEAGLLGKIFGNGNYARMNIAGTIACILTIVGILMLFIPVTGLSAAEYWKIAAPIITLILGYIFGKNSN